MYLNTESQVDKIIDCHELRCNSRNDETANECKSIDLRSAGEFANANARHSPKRLRNDEQVESHKDVVVGRNSKAQKSLKTKVKEAILNAQIEQHREDNWELPIDTNDNAERIDDWDLLQKLG